MNFNNCKIIIAYIIPIISANFPKSKANIENNIFFTSDFIDPILALYFESYSCCSIFICITSVENTELVTIINGEIWFCMITPKQFDNMLYKFEILYHLFSPVLAIIFPCKPI